MMLQIHSHTKNQLQKSANSAALYAGTNNFNPEGEHPFEFPHSLRPGKIIIQNT